MRRSPRPTAPSSLARAASRGVLALAVGAWLLALAPAPAAAGEPSNADKATARDLLHEGKQLRQKNDHAGALRKFQGAWALVPTPLTGVALAREQIALGQLVEAREVLGDIERMPVKPTESGEGSKARAEAASLHAEIAPRIPVLEIAVHGVAPDETVALTIDGRPEPRAAAEAGLRIDPGTHVVVATVRGQPQSKTFEAKESTRGKLDFEFKADAAASTPTATPAPQNVTTTSTAAPVVGARASAAAADASAPSPLKWIGAVAIGAGLVGMGVGGFLGLSAKSAYDSAKSDHCPTGACDPAGMSAIADARSRAGSATIIVGVGAAVAVGGVVMVLAAPSSSPSKVGVTSVGVGLGSISVGGRF